jgi:hypothetical protein
VFRASDFLYLLYNITMQYQIPQFTEIEDQIFGSLTFKQFVYIVGGAGLDYVFIHFLPIFLSIPIVIVVSIFVAMLAFYKVNNRAFIDTVESAVKYFFGSKLYLWKKNWNKEKKGEDVKVEIHSKVPQYKIPAISQDKLKELSWSLDINEKIK